jgi:hypothetical protein
MGKRNARAKAPEASDRSCWESKDQWEAGVWQMDKEQWHLLWTSEQGFWKAVPRLLAAGTARRKG